MKYPCKIYKTQVEDHVFWVAESTCLKGCVGQGETADGAVSELEENEIVWLDAAAEIGIEIPIIPIETMNEYSGKFTVRISPAVHQDAAYYAQKEHISLNQYVNDAIVAQNARREMIRYVAPEMRRAVLMFKSLLYDSSPTISSGVDRITYGRSVNRSFKNYSTSSNLENQSYYTMVEKL